MVVGCPKKFGDVGKGRRKVAFFHLPTDPIILKKWCDILSLDINNLSASRSERVCSQHFSISDVSCVEGKTLLAKGALPINSNKAGTCSFAKDFYKKILLLLCIDGSGRVSRSLSETALGRNTASSGRSRTFSIDSDIADISQADEIQYLRAEVLSLKLQTLPPSLETYENDNESISLYTGFPSYAVARLVLDLTEPGMNGKLMRAHVVILFMYSHFFRLQHLGSVR